MFLSTLNELTFVLFCVLLVNNLSDHLFGLVIVIFITLTDALTRAHGQVIEFSSHAADAGAQSLPSIRPLQAPLGL